MGKASRRKKVHIAKTLQAEAEQTLRRVSGDRQVILQATSAEKIKISESLGKLLDLEVAQGASQAEYESAMKFIVLAWNMSVLSEFERQAAVQQVANLGGNAVVRQEMAVQLMRLIQRKQSLFPYDQRRVMSWDMRFQRGKMYLSAVAINPN